MRPITSCPSISSYSRKQIRHRGICAEEPGNMGMSRASLGPFPDEYILSGLDKMLYFCGIKNVCELIEKFPLRTDFYLSSSSSDLDACCRASNDNLKLSNYAEDKSCGVASLRIEESNKCLTGSDSYKTCSLDHKEVCRETSDIKLLPSWRKSDCKLAASTECRDNLQDKEKSHFSKIISMCMEGGKKSIIGESHFTCPENIRDCPLSKESSKNSTCVKIKTVGFQDEHNRKPSWSIGNKPRECKKLWQRKNLPKIIGTKWAMTKINIFDDCSRTYEILEIKGRLPQSVIPCKTAIIFAVLPDGSTISFDYVKAKK